MTTTHQPVAQATAGTSQLEVLHVGAHEAAPRHQPPEEAVRRLRAANHQLRKELERALTCPVTRLPARAAWTMYAERFITTHPHGVTATVLLVDLDRFKPINDRYGHHVGDAVLATTGQRLQRWCTDRGGRAGRLGGDEFAAIVPDSEDLPGSLKRLREQLQQPIHCQWLRTRLQTSASIGTARLADLPFTDLTSALRAADLSMYRAKGARRGHRRVPLRAHRRRLAEVLTQRRSPAVS